MPTKRILLDASRWHTVDDFYTDFLPTLGAPDWHGRNLNALNDSICTGDINRVIPPYSVEIAGIDSLPDQLRQFLRRLEQLFSAARAQGVDVSLRFDSTP